MQREGWTLPLSNYDTATLSTEPVQQTLLIPDGTTKQLVGGVTPLYSTLSTVTFFRLLTDKVLLVAFEGVTITVDGWTVGAGGLVLLPNVTLTDIAIRFASGDGDIATVDIMLDGS